MWIDNLKWTESVEVNQKLHVENIIDGKNDKRFMN